MTALYSRYDVLNKWASPSFDATTRRVLAQRLHVIPERRFFTQSEWSLLEAIAARVMPQPERADPIPIVPWIDDLLTSNRGEGFRHDNMSPVQAAWHAGLAAIDTEALRRHGCGFTDLDSASCDVLLRAIENDDVDPAIWTRVPAQRFFIDILVKTMAGIYYSHPGAWSEIGFGGPASPRGYVRLGFNERDPWEAKESR